MAEYGYYPANPLTGSIDKEGVEDLIPDEEVKEVEDNLEWDHILRTFPDDEQIRLCRSYASYLASLQRASKKRRRRKVLFADEDLPPTLEVNEDDYVTP